MSNLLDQLSNIYWMGGSPCSGKSSTAQVLSERFGLHYYNCDEAFFRHARLITPEAQPRFFRAVHCSSEELWMRPVKDLVADEIEIYREQLPFILEDLLSLPAGTSILAEGAALLPELVAPLLKSSRRGIWLVPTPAFQWKHYSQREWAKDVVKACSNPDQAFHNWMDRDVGFAEQVLRQARRLGLSAIIVDGSLSIEDTTAQVQAHFEIG